MQTKFKMRKLKSFFKITIGFFKVLNHTLKPNIRKRFIAPIRYFDCEHWFLYKNNIQFDAMFSPKTVLLAICAYGQLTFA